MSYGESSGMRVAWTHRYCANGSLLKLT